MKNVEHKWTVQDIPSQAGRLALVTGATSGVGFYAARELARKSATVIMPARDMRKAKEAAERIEAEVPKAQLYLAQLDLAEFVAEQLSCTAKTNQRQDCDEESKAPK
jgi:NAD(P)-dependent dehydrogenase (short-subunit alcohol dehydrogenase family)